MQREKSSPSSKATWTPETEIVVYLASVKKNKKNIVNNLTQTFLADSSIDL